MQNFISRILDGLTAGLLRQAERLVRLSAARHVVGEYQAAYDDATVLEASGKKQLAEFLRSELDEALDGSNAVTSATVAEAAPRSLNGAGDHGPFAALSGPGASAAVVADPSATPAATKEPAKRRGRPRKASSNGRRSKRETKRVAAVETSDSTTLTGD